MTSKDKRTQWKGDQLVYGDLIAEPNNSSEDLYCLTFPQTKALISILELYRYTTRWYGDTVDGLLIERFVSDTQRRLMMGCGCGEIIIVIFRWNSEGELESSEDNGETWTDAGNVDPRHTAPEFPPPIGDMANKCAAADSAVTSIIVEVFNNLTEGMALVTLDEVLRTWVQTYIGTSNPLLALIAVVRNLIYGLAVTTIIASLTTDVWDKLRCCFRCNISPELDFDEARWVDLRTCITEDITGVAGIFLEHLIYLLGWSGSTNIARSGLGSPEADCSECPCEIECGIESWHIVNYNGVDVGAIIGTGVNYIDVTGSSHPDFATPFNAMIQTDNDDICCMLNSFELQSGSPTPNTFGVLCGNARWPSSPNVGFGLPQEVNTVFVRGDTGTNFVMRIYFA